MALIHWIFSGLVGVDELETDREDIVGADIEYRIGEGLCPNFEKVCFHNFTDFYHWGQEVTIFNWITIILAIW